MDSRPGNIFTVSELTAALKDLIEESWPSVVVEGEISGLRRHASGHLYFALKDEGAVLQSVSWRSSSARLPPTMREGDRVVAAGRLTLYEPRGQYQLVVASLRPAGRGDLAARLEETRRRLEADGLLDPARRRDLPPWPQRVAVVTSPSGAVLHDIRSVLARRAPHVEVVLVPSPVQGIEAVPGLLGALALLNRTAGTDLAPDLVIIARGGGSIEDLWAFQEEMVVRAVAALPFPTISAVGHETDTTLCDLVADLRAPTPSVAAELASPSRQDLRDDLASVLLRMAHAVSRQIEDARHRLQTLAGRPCLTRPHDTLGRAGQRLDQTAERFLLVGRRLLDRPGARLEALSGRLNALDPMAVLSRGYAAVSTLEGVLVVHTDHVRPGDVLNVRIRDSVLRVRVESLDHVPLFRH